MAMLDNMRRIQDRVDRIKKSCGEFKRNRPSVKKNTFASEIAKAQQSNQAQPMSANKVTEPSADLKADVNKLVEKYAGEQGLKPEVVRSLIAVASGFDSQAVGNNGQLGLMQVKPEIFQQFGYTNPFDPDQNISAGTKHLSQMLNRNGGNLELALAAYNSDPASVKRFGGTPPFPDTQSFVSQILAGLGGNNRK
jgi:soluble lytic murein transglycosylase-like protein